MTRVNKSASVLLAIALAVLLHVIGDRANGSVINVLSGLEWTSETNLNLFGPSNADVPKTFTDGGTTSSNSGTLEYIGYDKGGTVVYDLGSPTAVNEFGIWDGLGSLRGAPETLTIDFSNDPTFSTGVVTDVVNLVDNLTGTDQAYYQTALITGATARYVRFNFPADPNFVGPPASTGLSAQENSSDGYYNVQSDPNDATVSELELYHVPEPASLGLLLIGGAALLRRRRA